MSDTANVYLFICRLEHYSSQHKWMKDSRFLRELENDSVDTDILDEELNSIKDEQAKTFET